MSESRKNSLIFASLIVLSVAVRFYAMGRASYWYDEMVSLSFARAPTWTSVFWDNNPPLYHTILKIWVELFGSSELATRFLSGLFSVGATAVVMRIGFELRGRDGAVAAGLVHSLSVLSLAYAQETRMYALFELATAVQLLYFARVSLGLAGACPRKLFWASGFLALTHYLSIVPLFIEALSLLASRWRELGRQRRAVLAALGGSAFGLLVLAASYLNFFKWDPLLWQLKKFELEPEARWMTRVVLALFNDSWLVVASSAALLAAAAFGGTVEGRRSRRMLATLVLAPLALMQLASLATQRAVFLPRYFIFLIPPLACWMGMALVDLRKRLEKRLLSPAWALGVFVLIAPFAARVPAAYEPRKENWREAARRVSESGARFVLTASKPAVRHPYFDSQGIKVMQLDWTLKAAREDLRTEALARRKVWLVDSRTNAVHFESVKEWAEGLGLVTREEEVETSGQPTIRMLLIEDPNP